MIRRLSREHRTTIVYGMLGILLMLVLLQLWLLVATMNAYLGGDDGVVWPAAGVSFACFLLCVGLLRHLFLLEGAR